MNVALARRVERLEERRMFSPRRTTFDLNTRHGKIRLAQTVYAALMQGVMAKDELDADDGSLSPDRRAELSKTLENALKVAALWKK